jgi:hypothetical protein
VTDQPGARTLHCPHCLCDVEHQAFAITDESPNLARDVQRRGLMPRWLFWSLIGLGFSLCALEIGLLRFQVPRATSVEESIDRLILSAAGFGALDLLVIVTVARAGSWYFPAWQGAKFTAGALGMLVLATVFVLAVVVFLFTVCLSMG